MDIVQTMSMTPGQRFAAEYGDRAVQDMLKTIRLAKRIALTITVAVMVMSYQHQRHYLLGIGMDTIGAWILPLAIDAATLLCVKMVAAVGMHKTAKVLALCFLVLPIGASGYVNFVGSPTKAVGIAYLIAVALIAVVETLKAFIKPDFNSILAEEDRIQPAKQVGRKTGKRCEPGCSCGKHKARTKRSRRRSPKAPAAAQTSPGMPPAQDAPSVEEVAKIAA